MRKSNWSFRRHHMACVVWTFMGRVDVTCWVSSSRDHPCHASVTSRPCSSVFVRARHQESKKMLHNEDQPGTGNNGPFARHRDNVPISQNTETQATNHTPGEPRRNSGFLQEKEGQIAKIKHRFPRKIAHFCANLSKKKPNYAFSRQTEPVFLTVVAWSLLWHGFLTMPRFRPKACPPMEGLIFATYSV